MDTAQHYTAWPYRMEAAPYRQTGQGPSAAFPTVLPEQRQLAFRLRQMQKMAAQNALPARRLATSGGTSDAATTDTGTSDTGSSVSWDSSDSSMDEEEYAAMMRAPPTVTSTPRRHPLPVDAGYEQHRASFTSMVPVVGSDVSGMSHVTSPPSQPPAARFVDRHFPRHSTPLMSRDRRRRVGVPSVRYTTGSRMSRQTSEGVISDVGSSSSSGYSSHPDSAFPTQPTSWYERATSRGSQMTSDYEMSSEGMQMTSLEEEQQRVYEVIRRPHCDVTGKAHFRLPHPTSVPMTSSRPDVRMLSDPKPSTHAQHDRRKKISRCLKNVGRRVKMAGSQGPMLQTLALL